MKESIVKTVGLSDLSSVQNTIKYIDEYIVATNNIDDLFNGEQDIRLSFCAIISCNEGTMNLTLNEAKYTLRKNDMLVILPYSLMGNINMDENTKIGICGLAPEFIRSISETEVSIDRILADVHRNPMFHMQMDDSKRVTLQSYYNIISAKISDSNKYLRKAVLRYAVSAMFCEIMAEIGTIPSVEKREPISTPDNTMRVFKLFLKELGKDDGRHRSVNYYADKICYSPKYLSFVVKTVSGRTALSLINEHTMKQVKYQLLYSDKSIKQISEEFNFPNLSFFGKYVKRNVGMSPAQYRAKSKIKAEEEEMQAETEQQ
jgi:AraC-like DNA-binding protein